ncbi:MAG TPA: hypothetical protein VHP83_05955 [Aggregatilineaceae bacterium]|nr:hypothetical protein [Aggregatilineaceae bacterium]
MTDPDHLMLDDIAYTADVNLFLTILARIIARLFGEAETSDDNEHQDQADEIGLLDEGSESTCE